MQLTRRGFLRLLGAAAPMAAAAPTYFFAPDGGWKSDIIANPTHTFMGIAKAIYPGRLSTPLAVGATCLTPALIRECQNRLRLAAAIEQDLYNMNLY